MSVIFISYRRDDSQDIVGRIVDRLLLTFGRDKIFLDSASIPLGSNFDTEITNALKTCKIILVIIGPQWLTLSNRDGTRMVDLPGDYVAKEIQMALTRNIPVIPVFVTGAIPPAPEELPDSIKPLSFHNGIPVRADPDFSTDTDRLIQELNNLLSKKKSLFLKHKYKGIIAILLTLSIGYFFPYFKKTQVPRESTKGAQHSTPVKTELTRHAHPKPIADKLRNGLNILIFNASDDPRLHARIAKMLKDTNSTLNITSHLNWVQKFSMQQSLIFFQRNENRKQAEIVARLLPGKQYIRNYMTDPGIFFGFSEHRDLIIFAGKDLGPISTLSDMKNLTNITRR